MLRLLAIMLYLLAPVVVAQGGGFTLDEGLYHEALRAVQEGRSDDFVKGTSNANPAGGVLSQEWAAAWQKLQGQGIEARLQGQLAMLQVLRACNPSATEPQLSNTLAWLQACAQAPQAHQLLSLALCLLQGHGQGLTWPHNTAAAIQLVEQAQHMLSP